MADRSHSPSPRLHRKWSSIDGGEIALFNDTQDRKKWDQLSEFYAIIITTEHLENLRISGGIGLDEYTATCSVLISQFKDAQSAHIANGTIKTANDFFQEYQLDTECPFAWERLAKYGVPATVLHRTVDERDQIGRARQAAETTQCFITAMDALKLEQRAVDDVQPLISELTDRLNKIDGLSPNFEGMDKVKEWLITLNAMRASDELSEDQVRQLLYDLDTSYSAFFRYLETTTNKP